MIKLTSDIVHSISYYIGPSVAILITQILIAASVGALTMLGIYHARIAAFLRKLRRK